MKAQFSALVVLLGLAYLPAHAQFNDRAVERPAASTAVFDKEATDKAAAALTRQMANRLRLNEGQYLKLYAVNRIRVAQMGEINTFFKADETGRTARLSELDAQYDQECSRILSPSQLSQLHEEQSAPVMTAGTTRG